MLGGGPNNNNRAAFFFTIPSFLNLYYPLLS
jgi:hypothetical protein